MERICYKCRVSKIVNEDNFSKEKGRLAGHSYICKPCDSERGKKKYAKNPRLGRYKKYSEDQKRRRLFTANRYRKTIKGRAIFMLKSYQQIDKKKGRMCDLTQSDVLNILTQTCAYCGDGNYNNIGCDRLDNSLGHLLSNIQPCCDECNVAKSNHFTHDEMIIIGNAIRIVKDLRKKSL